MEPKIRVKIQKTLDQVTVSGRDLKRFLWPTNSMQEYLGKKTIHFNCKSKYSFNRKKPIRLASISSNTGILEIEREKYKGTVHVQTSEKFNGCDIINELFLEDYLATLLPKEMNSTWPIEALKAQAVAARSYAYHKLMTDQVSRTKGFNTYYDIENSEKHQVNGSYFDATRKTMKAAKGTKGEVLALAGGKVSPIFFHSKCGGKTLTPDQVWTNKVPGYRSVPCPFCHKHGKKNWKHSFKEDKVQNHIKRAIATYNRPRSEIKNSNMQFYRDSKSNHQLKVSLNGAHKSIKKSRLRSTMGRKALPSNYFNLKKVGDEIIVSGSGYGHGVGMCQFGAKELALQGFSYKQILAHYFPELDLIKVY